MTMARAGAVPAQTPAAVWGTLAVLMLVLFSGYSRHLGLPLDLDRLLLPLVLVLLLTSPGIRRIKPRATHVLMAVLVVWAMISLVWWDNITAGSLFALVDQLLIPFVLFTIAGVLFATPERRDRLLLTASLIGVYLGGTALAERVAPSFVFPHYITALKAAEKSSRAGGPFLLPDALGTACLLCVLCGLTLMLRRSRWSWWGAAGLTGGIVGVLLSLSRGVWVATALTLLVSLIVLPSLRRLIPAGILALVPAGTAVLATIPDVVVSVLGRVGTIGPVHDRLAGASASLRLLGDLPWTGIGWQRFHPHGAEWVRLSDGYALPSSAIALHNIVLARAAELGIPAALVFVAILALVARDGLRPANGEEFEWRRLALLTLVAWVGSGMIFPMTAPFPNSLAWLLVGVGTAAVFPPPRAPRRVALDDGIAVSTSRADGAGS